MISSIAGPQLLDREGRAVAAGDNHLVQFYESEDYLYQVVSDFLGSGLQAGQPLVVIATEPHREAFCRELTAKGFDVAGVRHRGQLTLLDARETLATFMVDGMPDWDLFLNSVGALVEKAETWSGSKQIRAYGEMVDLLWRDGNPQAAIRLEELWNELGRRHSFSLLCAYVMGNFFKEAHSDGFNQICRTHTHVIPTEKNSQQADSDGRMREVSFLQQRTRALENEIGERKIAENALRASQLELQDFLENAAEGIHAVGADGTILWANRAELELLGYSKDEYIGKPIGQFHVDAAVVEDIFVRLGRNETLRDYEARLRSKDGSIRHVLIQSNALFRDGKLVHTRCFTRDVTERKRLEQELKQQNENLLRTVKFSEMFVGILGHDLRNPLSAIATAASLLTRRADNPKVADPAKRILTSSARMARMIDQLLDFTCVRLGKGLPLNRRLVDLREVCRMTIDELNGDGQARDIDVVMTGAPVGHWDGDKLAQLISNLVSNALTHGQPEQPIRVRADATSTRGVCFEVQNGGAIPSELLPNIFEPFRCSPDRKYAGSSGLGLGLYISQQIAHAHGGTIQVTSSEAEGTCFSVWLPMSPPVAAAFVE